MLGNPAGPEAVVPGVIERLPPADPPVSDEAATVPEFPGTAHAETGSTAATTTTSTAARRANGCIGAA